MARSRTTLTRKTPESGADNVVRFPPMPRTPAAPRLPPDPRQTGTTQTLRGVARVAGSTMQILGPNFETGFHASAVDLGRLQSALTRGVGRLDGAQVAERWDEVFAWMRGVLRTWVQRCKKASIVRREHGIRFEIETQDDHGYYTYGFDVFPGKR